ncbi:hypothetical protein HYZ97_02510 [Candidatus Pacearchaeota archaeon]|nr:hypothetical protein [Candidatus Pacearchaeota archaeon]
MKPEETKRPMEMKKANSVYVLQLKSQHLPFAAGKARLQELEAVNELLQKFVRFVEKKFDSIWYIGTDFLGSGVYERFMFHHGGFMEVSLQGEIRCFLPVNKLDKLKEAVVYALEKISSPSRAKQLSSGIKIEQRLISLKDSLKGG